MPSDADVEKYHIADLYVGEPCPSCEDGILVETEMGLGCDNCVYDCVDPKKNPPKEEE